jgi:hypothetical protein
VQETDSVYVSTDTVIETLICQAGLLREELSIHIDEATGELCTLPDVLNGVVPRPRSVVTLVESLATTLSSRATLNAESACKVLQPLHVTSHRHKSPAAMKCAVLTKRISIVDSDKDALQPMTEARQHIDRRP